jgi:hypothetical protein
MLLKTKVNLTALFLGLFSFLVVVWGDGDVFAQSCTGGGAYTYNTYVCNIISGCVSTTNSDSSSCFSSSGYCGACQDCGQNCDSSTCNITNRCPGGPPCGSRELWNNSVCSAVLPTNTPTPYVPPPTTPPGAPTNTPTPTTQPPTPGPGTCDTSCGYPCGHRNSSGVCDGDDWGCCHRTCQSCACVTVPNGGGDSCDSNSDCSCITPTPTPAVTTTGNLSCRNGGMYSSVTTPKAWVVNAAGTVLRETDVASNGSFSLANWTLPGYPTSNYFAVRSGFTVTNPNPWSAFFDGVDSQAWIANCDNGNTAFEACEFDEIVDNGTTSGFNFKVTDVNPATMQVASCSSGGTAPFTLTWQHPTENPGRYRVMADWTGDGWPGAGDISCWINAAAMGCGSGTCTFTPSAPDGSACDYVAGGTYSWWGVMPKYDIAAGNQFCTQTKTFSCVPPTPTPTPSGGSSTIRVQLAHGGFNQLGDACSINGGSLVGSSGLSSSMLGSLQYFNTSGSGTYGTPVTFNWNAATSRWEVVLSGLVAGTYQLRYNAGADMGVKCPDNHLSQSEFQVTVDAGVTVTRNVFVGWDIWGYTGAASYCNQAITNLAGDSIQLQDSVGNPLATTQYPENVYRFENLDGLVSYRTEYTPAAGYTLNCPGSVIRPYNNLYRSWGPHNFTTQVTDYGTVQASLHYYDDYCHGNVDDTFNDPDLQGTVNLYLNSDDSNAPLVTPGVLNSSLGWERNLVPDVEAPGVYRSELQLSGPNATDFMMCDGGVDVFSVAAPAPPTTTTNLYIAPADQPWWQALGGDVHVNSTDEGGINIVSSLPDGEYFADRLGDGVGSAGLASIFGGDMALGQGKVRNDGNWKVAGSWFDPRKRPENYNYFMAKYAGMTTPLASSAKPSCGTGSCGYEAGELDILAGETSWSNTSNWGAGEKIVVFVAGDLTINENITLPTTAGGSLQGVFLAFIVSGNIIVGDSVDTLEGVYIANRSVQLGAGAEPLKTRGTIVGWAEAESTGNGVVIARTPATGASVTFEYWPELVLNTPKELTSTRQYFVEALPRTVDPTPQNTPAAPTTPTPAQPWGTPTPTPTPVQSPTPTPTPTPTPSPTPTPCTPQQRTWNTSTAACTPAPPGGPITLDWTTMLADTCVPTSYKLNRCVGTTCAPGDYVTTGGTTYEDSVSASGTYRYTVQACNGSNCSLPSVVREHTCSPPPPTPTPTSEPSSTCEELGGSCENPEVCAEIGGTSTATEDCAEIEGTECCYGGGSEGGR